MFTDRLEWGMAGMPGVVSRCPDRADAPHSQPPHHTGHPLLLPAAERPLLPDHQPVCRWELEAVQPAAVLRLPGHVHQRGLLHAGALQLYDDGGECMCVLLSYVTEPRELKCKMIMVASKCVCYVVVCTAQRTQTMPLFLNCAMMMVVVSECVLLCVVPLGMQTQTSDVVQNEVGNQAGCGSHTCCSFKYTWKAFHMKP